MSTRRFQTTDQDQDQDQDCFPAGSTFGNIYCVNRSLENILFEVQRSVSIFHTEFEYACQTGSKCRKIVFFLFKHNIYVRIAIYTCMSKLQYNYTSTVYKIYVQVDVWGFVLYCLVLM